MFSIPSEEKKEEDEEFDQSIKITDDLEYQGHKAAIVDILLFENPISRLVSVCLDGSIRIWNTENGECEKEFTEQSSSNHSIKFTNEVFLTGSSDGQVVSYSIITKDVIKRFKYSLENTIWRLAKIDDDTFASGDESGKIQLISYSKNEVISTVEKTISKVAFFTKIKLSYNFPNCLYTNLALVEDCVRLIDFKNDTIIQKYIPEDKTGIMFSIEVFQNKKQDEIMLHVGENKEINIYNLGNDITELSKNKERKSCDETIRINEALTSCRIIEGGKYLLIGNDVGCIYIVDLELKKVSQKKEVTTRELMIDFSVEKMKSKKRNVKIFVCGTSHSVFSYDVTGLDIENQEDVFLKNDLRERIHFLWEDEEMYNSQEKFKIFGEIKLSNIHIHNVLKCLMS